MREKGNIFGGVRAEIFWKKDSVGILEHFNR